MQVGDVLAHPRDQVADVRSSRAFAGEPFLERGDLVGEMRERPAGVGLSRFRVVGDRRVGGIATACEKSVAFRRGPHTRHSCSQIPAFIPL